MTRNAMWAAILAAASSVALAGAAPPVQTLRFERAAETQLGELFAAWKAERAAAEQRAHPGKRGSHWWWPAALTVGDIDGDGDADIVVAHHGAPGTRLYVNLLKEKGRLIFEDQTRRRTLAGTFDKAIADGSPCFIDLNHDGAPDLVAPSDESPPLNCLNDGQGRFRISRGPFNFAQLRQGDVNGDGRIDVIKANPLGGGAYNRFVNQGNGTFKGEYADAPGWLFVDVPPACKLPQDVAAARGKRVRVRRQGLRCRLSGGGVDEILVNVSIGYGGTALCWYIRTPAGAWEEVARQRGLPRRSRAAALCDFDADGDTDGLLVGSRKSGVYLNDGRGTFTRSADGLAKRLTPRAAGKASSVMTALDSYVDLDEDGLCEIVLVTMRFGGETGVFRNAGGGRFEPAGPSLAGCMQLAVCDMDGDARMDIVGLFGDGPRLFLNRTPPAGNFLNVQLKGPAVNPLGVDALVEAYRPGRLGEPAALIARVRNNTPGIPVMLSVGAIGHQCGGGLPVHLGLGEAGKVDLRIRYPGGHVVEARDVLTNRTVAPAP